MSCAPEVTRRLPRPGDDTTPETGPDRGECECGDWRDQHVLGRGPCKVCRYGTPPPDGADGCQRYREAFTCDAPTEQLNSSAVGIKGKARHTPGGGVA